LVLASVWESGLVLVLVLEWVLAQGLVLEPALVLEQASHRLKIAHSSLPEP